MNSIRNTRAKKKPYAGAADLLKIAERLKNQVGSADAGPSWRDRVMTACSAPDEYEGMMKSARILLDNGRLDPDSAFFMIASGAAHLSSRAEETDAELKEIERAIEDLWENYKGEDGADKLDELEARQSIRHDAIMAAVLREHGENEVADLLLENSDRFIDRMESGMVKVLGPQTEETLSRFRAAKKYRSSRSS